MGGNNDSVYDRVKELIYEVGRERGTFGGSIGLWTGREHELDVYHTRWEVVELRESRKRSPCVKRVREIIRPSFAYEKRALPVSHPVIGQRQGNRVATRLAFLPGLPGPSGRSR